MGYPEDCERDQTGPSARSLSFGGGRKGATTVMKEVLGPTAGRREEEMPLMVDDRCVLGLSDKLQSK